MNASVTSEIIVIKGLSAGDNVRSIDQEITCQGSAKIPMLWESEWVGENDRKHKHCIILFSSSVTFKSTVS